MMDFQNAQQSIESLPDINEINFTGLPKAHLKSSLISYTVFFLILGSILGSIHLFTDEIPTEIIILIAILLAILLVTVLIMTSLGFKHKAYALRDHDILYKSGLIWRDTTVVPFNRIQHVEIGEGPIERLFNLASLRVFTAGGSKSDLVIPGLMKEEAQRIKAFLAAKISSHE